MRKTQKVNGEGSRTRLSTPQEATGLDGASEVMTSAVPLLSRRQWLKAGGALVVAVALPAQLLTRKAHAQATGALADPKQLDGWLAIHSDNTATVYLGKVELGQGNSTTLLQLVAEELDMSLSQVVAAQVSSARSQNQGPTVSSSSIQNAGPPLRAAAAEARRELLRRASVSLGVPVESLRVTAGKVSIAGKADAASVSYGSLLGDRPFELAVSGTAPLKPVSEYRIVGQSVPRRDLPAKVSGQYEYVQHVHMNGMLHARVVRPRGQDAYGRTPRIRAVDEQSVAGIPGVRLVRRGDFLAVVAPRQWDAVRAAQALKVQWDQTPLPGGDAQLYDRLRAAPAKDSTLVNEGDATQGLASAAVRRQGRFHGPYQAHGPFAPGCAVAEVSAQAALIVCSTQDVFALRTRAASVLSLPATAVQVRYVEGSGCFGHSCADDAALVAAIVAQEIGAPARVQFMRWDELGWDNYGPAHVGEVAIGADTSGRITAFEYHGWHHGWMIEETAEQMANGKPATEFSTGAGSLFVNKFDLGGMYDITNWRLVNHAVSGLTGYLKGANLRSPMDLSYSFAAEQTLDDVAHALAIDPVELRRRNIKNPRWMGVLNAVVQSATWQPRSGSRQAPPASAQKLTGRGVALGTHRAALAAAVAEIEVDRSSGQIRVLHIHAAMDCGLAINPAVVESQISGMAQQATSRMLFEEVHFNEQSVTSLDWVSYPVLRFGDHPKVSAIVVQRTDQPSIGAGEEGIPAVGAAIANAFFDATGVRMHQYPLTPERVRAALA